MQRLETAGSAQLFPRPLSRARYTKSQGHQRGLQVNDLSEILRRKQFFKAHILQPADLARAGDLVARSDGFAFLAEVDHSTLQAFKDAPPNSTLFRLAAFKTVVGSTVIVINAVTPGREIRVAADLATVRDAVTWSLQSRLVQLVLTDMQSALSFDFPVRDEEIAELTRLTSTAKELETMVSLFGLATACGELRQPEALGPARTEFDDICVASVVYDRLELSPTPVNAPSSAALH